MKTITITFKYNEGKEWQEFWDNYIAKNISCANPNGDIQVPTWYADRDCVDGFKELLEALENIKSEFERLKERIARVIDKSAIDIYSQKPDNCAPEIVVRYFEAINKVKRVIDEILKPQLEFIDNESEPQEGDLIKLDGWAHTAISREIYADMGKIYGKRAHFVELDCIADFDDKEQLKWFHNSEEGNGIIQRNNKNTFNVDKINNKGE